jgi:deoxyribose-phosphate aldolase
MGNDGSIKGCSRKTGGVQGGFKRACDCGKAKHNRGAERPEGIDATLAAMIDHTLLKPDATRHQIETLCEEAVTYGFASVCVNPCHCGLAYELLKASDVAVCTVIGFPLGATTPLVKAVEARDAIASGASEVDMVINVGALKAGEFDRVLYDIQSVVDAARGRALVKVILETGLLTDEEKVQACTIAKRAGADFVKTSTGFGHGGATVEDVALMRRTVGTEMGVKASGGVRDAATARAMVEAGASRIGASAGVKIVTEK